MPAPVTGFVHEALGPGRSGLMVEFKHTEVSLRQVAYVMRLEARIEELEQQISELREQIEARPD